MQLIVWALLIITALIGVGVNVIKKFAVGGIQINIQNAFQLSTWIGLLTNPVAISSLIVSLGAWGLSLWAFSLEDANKVVAVTLGLAIPALFLNILLNMKFFSETLSSNQIIGLGILVASMVLGVAGVYMAGGGLA